LLVEQAIDHASLGEVILSRMMDKESALMNLAKMTPPFFLPTFLDAMEVANT